MDVDQASLEAAIRAAISKTLERLPWRTFSDREVARHLANEVIGATKKDSEGHHYAPDQFTLSIHPHETGELKRSPPEIQLDLAFQLRNVLEENGYLFIREPHVSLATDPTLKKGEVRVITWHSSEPGETGELLKEGLPVPIDRTQVRGFLVVQGLGHFPLDKSMVRLGRQPENDLVLDDPHVSRRHAEIRAESGSFKIVDMHSTAGTRVNGRLVGEHTLRPGDVIKLARIEIIYGEAPTGPPDVTPPYQPKPRPPKDREEVTPLDLRTLKFTDPLKPPSEKSSE
jgi:hypothetical protein